VRRRWDATTVIGLLAVLFGVAWLLGALGAVHVSIEGVVAVGLMLLGASLIITGRTDWSLSRRTWPIWLGAGLVAVLVATSSTFGVGDALQSVQFGNMTSTPNPAATVHGGFGNLTVDASRLGAGDTIKVDSVAGNTVIDGLPQDVPVRVDARVLAGQICVYGRTASNGVGASTNQTYAPAGTGGAPITLDVHQVFGQIGIGAGC
jgi:hypothetical protein